MVVIARLVRATHEHRDEGRRAGGATGSLSCSTAIMGGPDKPGHDVT
jgi:hypothetical protein